MKVSKHTENWKQHITLKSLLPDDHLLSTTNPCSGISGGVCTSCPFRGCRLVCLCAPSPGRKWQGPDPWAKEQFSNRPCGIPIKPRVDWCCHIAFFILKISCEPLYFMFGMPLAMYLPCVWTDYLSLWPLKPVHYMKDQSSTSFCLPGCHLFSSPNSQCHVSL